MTTIRIKVEPRFLGKLAKRFSASMKTSMIVRGIQNAGPAIIWLLRFRTEQVKDLGTYQRGWYCHRMVDGILVSNKAPHAQWVEFGRGPGGRPPISVIRAWVLRKGMDASAAWPVANAIAARGIPARPAIKDPAVVKEMTDIVNKQIDKYVDQALRRATQ